MALHGLSEWRYPPPVEAPSHADKSNIVKYAISEDLTGVNRANWLRTPLYWVWVHLHGKVPPIQNISVLARDQPQPDFTTLLDATACFQGIKRPHLTENNGESVLVYVLKPSVSVEYAARMTCPIRTIITPTDVVLTVHVRLKESLQIPLQGVDGIVTRMEPVAADAVNCNLPVDHATRYAGRIW
jgi:hypothetical protein